VNRLRAALVLDFLLTAPLGLAGFSLEFFIAVDSTGSSPPFMFIQIFGPGNNSVLSLPDPTRHV